MKNKKPKNVEPLITVKKTVQITLTAEQVNLLSYAASSTVNQLERSKYHPDSARWMHRQQPLKELYELMTDALMAVRHDVHR